MKHAGTMGACVLSAMIAVGCAPDAPTGSAQSRQAVAAPAADPAPARITCDPLISDALVETVDVLFNRGFEAAMTESFTGGAADLLGCQNDPKWKAHLKTRAPAGYQLDYGRWIADVVHDIYTGERYDFTDPVALAESLPECFAREEDYKTCDPDFHPYLPAIDGNERITEDGFLIGQSSCRLDENWKTFCTLPASLDGCWSFAKGDLIAAPPSKAAQQSRIQLAKAVRTDRLAQSTPVKRRTPSKPRRRSAAPGSAPTPLSAEARRLPVCDALQWEYLLK